MYWRPYIGCARIFKSDRIRSAPKKANRAYILGFPNATRPRLGPLHRNLRARGPAAPGWGKNTPEGRRATDAASDGRRYPRGFVWWHGCAGRGNIGGDSVQSEKGLRRACS